MKKNKLNITINPEEIPEKPVEQQIFNRKEKIKELEEVEIPKKPEVNLGVGDGLRLTERFFNKIFNYLIGNKINPLPALGKWYFIAIIIILILKIITELLK